MLLRLGGRVAKGIDDVSIELSTAGRPTAHKVALLLVLSRTFTVRSSSWSVAVNVGPSNDGFGRRRGFGVCPRNIRPWPFMPPSPTHSGKGRSSSSYANSHRFIPIENRSRWDSSDIPTRESRPSSTPFARRRSATSPRFRERPRCGSISRS